MTVAVCEVYPHMMMTFELSVIEVGVNDGTGGNECVMM